jgi:pimeloyl-ACP methyl ester carboxylesterase
MFRGSASYRRRTANNKSAGRFYTTDNIKHDIAPFATADVTLTDFLGRLSEAAKSRLMTAEQTKPVDPLYVYEVGSGSEPVILLHGLSKSFKYWEPMVNGMNKRKYHYIIPDLLGHGRSPSPEHLAYDVDTHLFFLFRDVIQHRKGPFHVIGHAMGSILAIELAARFPQKVKTLSLISLPYYESEQMAQKYVVQDIFNPHGHPLLNNKLMCKICCAVICQHRALWRPIIPFVVKDKPEDVVYDGMNHNFHGIYSSFEECIVKHRIDNAASALTKFKIPTRLIHGSEDKVVGVERAEAFYSKYFTACQLDVIAGPGCGHDIPITSAAQLADHITKFIAGE